MDIAIIIALMLGSFAGGWYVSYKLGKNSDLNTDTCMEFLHSKGYYVNINFLGEKK